MIEQQKISTIMIISSRRLELYKIARSQLDKRIDDASLKKIINTIPNEWFFTQTEKQNREITIFTTLEQIRKDNPYILDLIYNHLLAKGLLRGL